MIIPQYIPSVHLFNCIIPEFKPEKNQEWYKLYKINLLKNKHGCIKDQNIIYNQIVYKKSICIHE